jgi:hypothetical protein
MTLSRSEFSLIWQNDSVRWTKTFRTQLYPTVRWRVWYNFRDRETANIEVNGSWRRKAKQQNQLSKIIIVQLMAIQTFLRSSAVYRSLHNLPRQAR